MARTVTRQFLRDQARQLADEVDTTFVTDTTANEWIDQAYTALYDMLVGANPDWHVTEVPIYTLAGTLEYDLPNDFYQVRAVDRFESVVGDSADDIATNVALMVDRTDYHPIESFNFLDRGVRRPDWHPPRHTDGYGHVRYRVIRGGTSGTESRIRFEPDPGTRTYRLWYIPAAATLATDMTLLDGVNGYEDYVIFDVAARMMAKAETDATPVLRMKSEVVDRIEEMARKRDQGRPVQVADTRNRYRQPHSRSY